MKPATCRRAPAQMKCAMSSRIDPLALGRRNATDKTTRLKQRKPVSGANLGEKAPSALVVVLGVLMGGACVGTLSGIVRTAEGGVTDFARSMWCCNYAIGNCAKRSAHPRARCGECTGVCRCDASSSADPRVHEKSGDRIRKMSGNLTRNRKGFAFRRQAFGMRINACEDRFTRWHSLTPGWPVGADGRPGPPSCGHHCYAWQHSPFARSAHRQHGDGDERHPEHHGGKNGDGKTHGSSKSLNYWGIAIRAGEENRV
jgi:hypothetical protein